MNGKGYIYICSFDNGLIKVGASRENPSKEIYAHENVKLGFIESRLAFFWVSGPHYLFRRNIKSLLEEIRPFRLAYSNDWCHGLNFGDLISLASHLEEVQQTVTKSVSER